MRNEVFIAYSNKDKNCLKRIEVHLKAELQNTNVTVWNDQRIKPGSDWDQAIKEALKRAKVAILLVSADFLASSYIQQQELPSIFRASENEGLHIVWIAVKPTRAWENSAIGKLQCAHKEPEKSLLKRKHAEQEEVLSEVANYVATLLK